MELLFYTLTTSLIDGFSTTPQILILLFLLTSEKPAVRSVFYILGISFFYLLAGVLATMEFTHVHDLFNMLNGLVDSQPDRSYYLSQLVVGTGLIVAGAFYYFRRPKSIEQNGKVAEFLKKLNGFTAFVIGSIVTIGGLPGSIVYFAALDRIVTSGNPQFVQVLYIVLYNLIYVLPMVVPLVIYLLLHKKVEELAVKMHTNVIFWNRVLMVAFLVILGVLMLADSAVFYLTSKPIFTHKLI